MHDAGGRKGRVDEEFVCAWKLMVTWSVMQCGSEGGVRSVCPVSDAGEGKDVLLSLSARGSFPLTPALPSTSTRVRKIHSHWSLF